MTSTYTNPLIESPFIYDYMSPLKMDTSVAPGIKENYWGQNVTLVRGLRNIIDLNEEIALNRHYQDLLPEIKIVHIICDREFEHVSSSAIRELEKYGEADRYIVK